MNKNAQYLVNWIREYFADNEQTKAVIGMSGGKDSTIAAALLCEALGPDRVIAVRLPAGDTRDDVLAEEIIEYLGITHTYRIDIAPICQAMYNTLDPADITPVVTSNLPARVRMTMLYAIANSHHGRVVNTSNFSEWFVGYTTKYGDSAGDFGLFNNLLFSEVLAIGDSLSLPTSWVYKTPTDGLSGKTDADNLGFTYYDVDDYLSDVFVPVDVLNKIANRALGAQHKKEPMPCPPRPDLTL